MNRYPGGRKIKVQKLVSLPRYYFFLLKSISTQKRFLKKELKPELENFRRTNDGSLTCEDLKKITGYYSLGVPGILGEGFAVLRGNPLLPNERSALTFLGGISGLLDDLFDDPKKDASSLKHLITSPENMEQESTYNSLLIHFYKHGLSHTKYPHQIKLQAFNVYETQENSLKQQKKNNLDFLKTITWEKGGASFLFYRLCLNNTLDEPERDLVYHLGGLMQLGNDIFDVWEDYQAGLKTVATVTTDIKVLREMFFEDFEKTSSLAYKTNFQKDNIRSFLNLSELALSRVFVCLDQFEELQNSTGGVFIIQNYQRKQLICDMQKPASQLKAIRYFLK